MAVQVPQWSSSKPNEETTAFGDEGASPSPWQCLNGYTPFGRGAILEIHRMGSFCPALGYYYRAALIVFCAVRAPICVPHGAASVRFDHSALRPLHGRIMSSPKSWASGFWPA